MCGPPPLDSTTTLLLREDVGGVLGLRMEEAREKACNDAQIQPLCLEDMWVPPLWQERPRVTHNCQQW